MDKKSLSKLEELKAKGLIFSASDVPQPEKIPTGSLMLDYITDGGIPTRRLTQFYAKAGTGKSVQSYHCINNALKKYPDKIAILVDIEQRADTSWISNFVEEMDRLFIIQPEYIEDVTDEIRDIINSGIQVSIVVVDSIGAANTYRSAEKSAKIAEVGGISMGVGRFVRAAAPLANKNNIAFLLINQLREDIMAFVPSVHAPGGNQLHHALELNVYLRKTSEKATIRDENGEMLVVGEQIAFKVMKGKNLSKVIKTFFYSKPSELGDLGFDKFSEIVNLGVALGFIEKNAASYKYEGFPDGKLFGLPKVKEWFKENSEGFDILEQKIYSSLTKSDLIESESIED